MTTARTRGTSFEYHTLYKLREIFPDIKRVPFSGATQMFKGDLSCTDWLFECKKTMHNSIRITKEWLQKIEDEAEALNKEPAIVFSLRRTKPYVIMSLKKYMEMIENV